MFQAIENQFIYFPTKYPVGDWNPAYLDIENAFFETEDGETLHGWYCKACPSSAIAPAERSRHVVLYCHGNAGNISDRAPALAVWGRALGLDVFIFDYRGYGRSTGRPEETGLYRDSRAAYRWLTETKGVAPDRVVIRGGSLGGAVATELGVAVESAALIIENTFTSMPDVAKNIYPWLPAHHLMQTRFSNRDRISRYRRPVLVICGTHDTLVPCEQSRELYSLANEPKRLLEIEGAGHNDTIEVAGRRYFEEVASFLRDAAASQQRAVNR